MSSTEYNNLVFAISQKLDELNALDHLLFMCRGKLASGSEGNIHNTLSLCKKLEEQNNLSIDHLQLMKRLLKGVEDWVLLEKVEKFECKRKEYKALLEKVISGLDELNDVERLIAICRESVREGSEGNIEDVRSLFRELENQDNLEIDYLDVVKSILAETESNELLKEVEEFEERRIRGDKSEVRKAQRAAYMSSVRSTLVGVVNIKTVLKAVAGGLTVVSAMEVLSRWSSFDQLVAAVQTCVLPAGTRLVQITDGCVCLTVQAESLSALKTLWKLYQDGTLQKRLYDFFVTDEVRELADGEDVEVNVTIEEDEYQKGCLQLTNRYQEDATVDFMKRGRRNSDSAVYSKAREDPLIIRIQRVEAELQHYSQKVISLVQIIDSMRIGQFEEGDKSCVAGDEIKRRDKMGEFQPDAADLMGAEKFAFVQNYLDNFQETHSITTATSDSALGTHTVPSEFETEDIRDTSNLCLKDLSPGVRRELEKTFGDRDVREKFEQFFGLQRNFYSGYFYSQGKIIDCIGGLFPDTPVSILKEFFEAVQLYDVAELLAKVRPRSLHPVISSEEVETLRSGNLPTSYHNKTFVVIINDSVEGNNAKKIDTFFKDLNSRNTVTLVESILTEEKRKDLSNLQRKIQRERELEKTLEAMIEDRSIFETIYGRNRLKKNRDSIVKEAAFLRKEMHKKIELMNELKEKNQEATMNLSTAMDLCIRNPEKFTFIAVFFIIDEYSSILDNAALNEIVANTLALLPNHAKLVVGAPPLESRRIIPESLYVTFSDILHDYAVDSMIEIFTKRWYTLDLHSMMKEWSRTLQRSVGRFSRSTLSTFSTLHRFEKTKDQGCEEN
ncbi:uncharacterized protein LOC111329163 [Stylophora pistillata]|uniref:uncharacterized protein LOC111329163 n=1 Tax=Stylophora pistillata TaxID=50429 RepID=UPI000C04D8B5|nr:uncharacterized protein LOC111329163 [Stylophora pistillata]